MTNQTVRPAAPVVERPPVRLLLTILELTALGVLGSIAFGILSGLFAASLALVFVFGIGLIFFVGLVYAMFGVAWFEVARVSSLYELDLPALRWRPRTRPGFGGWVRSLGRQSVDGSMWRALANFVLACIAGFLILRFFWGMVWSAITAFAPLTREGVVDGPYGSEITVAWAPLVGILGVVVSVAAIIGLALLHRVIARALIVPSREAELTEQV
ncbi:MAG TPA: sensor domain-containing protein, partial [Microbacterium sp.]|nr:sensor domain-containing protein [Microbacterium sp.]